MTKVRALLALLALLCGVTLTASPASANWADDYSPSYTAGWNHQYQDRMHLHVNWFPQADGQGVTIDSFIGDPDVFNGTSCDAVYTSVDFDRIRIWNTNGTALYAWNPTDNNDCDWKAGYSGAIFKVNTNCAIITMSGVRPHVKDNPDPGPFTLTRTICD